MDLFVKKKEKSLFVHFQGHPEYGAQTLLKEYRRDIKRFLRGERETYPIDAARILRQFRHTDSGSLSRECSIGPPRRNHKIFP